MIFYGDIMSELIGEGNTIKRESGKYWVKNPNSQWTIVCIETDPFWSIKCVKKLEELYPENG